MHSRIHIHPEIADALQTGQPIVALESTIIAHGMPYPQNLETAQRLESIVREGGAVPATVAVKDGALVVGCDSVTIEELATAKNVAKVSRRDLPVILAQGGLGATTVSATLIAANLAGIRVFATGGIGGVHRGVADTWDISADIPELAKAQVAVVSAGAKSILDLPKTLEVLETAGVTVLGYRTEDFPAFFIPSSGLKLVHRSDSPDEVARTMKAKWELGLEGGILIANPVPQELAADSDQVQIAIEEGLRSAKNEGISGKALTPYLLNHIKQATGGDSLRANRALVENNVRLGTQIAVAYARNF